MRKAVAWTVYGVLTVLAAVSFSVSVYFVNDFFKLRKTRAVSIRMPQLTVMQLIVSMLTLFSGAILIPFDIVGFKDNYAFYLFIRVTFLVSIVTMKITRIWCFNWRYTLTRHEMETLWKSQMQLKESHSWAVRYSPVFSDWKRALLVSFAIATLLFSVCVGLVFASTHSRTATLIGGLTAFFMLQIPSFWTMYRTKECHDIYGVRNQLKLESYLVAAVICAAASMRLLPPLCLGHRFGVFAIDIVFITVYFFATTRFQLWKICQLPEALQSQNSGVKHLKRLFTLSTSDVSAQKSTALKSALSDYPCFELFAQHCLRELALKHLFFVVAYMRLKEYLFRFLKAEDLFDDAGERIEDGEMLQKVFRNPTFSKEETKPVTSSLLEKLKKAASDTSVIDDNERKLCQVASRSPHISSAKEKYRDEMGRIVELPLEVLQLAFAEYSLDGCVKAVRELFAKYMDFDSEYCINVSSASRKCAMSSLSTLKSADSADERTESLLHCIEASDELLVEVMQLLKKNSFSRFSRTEAFQKWLNTPK